MLGFESAANTHKGKVREINEDAYLATGNIFAVADGMGGHQAGELASALALSTALEYIEDHLEGEDPERLILEAFSRANDHIRQKAATQAHYRKMGTTLTMTLIIGETAYFGHVGDTRAYLFREGKLKRITSDHSLVAKMVEDGEITEQEARAHPQRNIILRALGPEPEVEVDVTAVKLSPDDLILICSDGVSGQLTDDQIADVLAGEVSANSVAERLVDISLATGGLDNITAVVVRATGDRVELPAEAEAVKPAEPALPAPVTTAKHWYRRKAIIIPLIVILVLAAVFGLGYLLFSRSYYVGASEGEVVIYQGFPFSVFNRRVARVVYRSGFELDLLPQSWESKVRGNLESESYEDAVETADRLAGIAEENTAVVPDLSTLPLELAGETLRNSELEVGGVQRSSVAGAPPSTVVRQDPVPGTKVKKGTKVDLWVTPPVTPVGETVQ